MTLGYKSKMKMARDFSRLMGRGISQKGTYALVLSAEEKGRIQIGRLGLLDVRRGYYVYVGSALGPGGLKARLSHHLNRWPRPHWHIDYLRMVARVEAIWYTCDSVRREHQWAEVLMRDRESSVPLTGFGSSDCTCRSHLCFFPGRPTPEPLGPLTGEEAYP